MQQVPMAPEGQQPEHPGSGPNYELTGSELEPIDVGELSPDGEPVYVDPPAHSQPRARQAPQPHYQQTVPPTEAHGHPGGAVSTYPDPADGGPTQVESQSQIQGAPQMDGPRLLIIGGNNRGREYPVGPGDASIGRGVDNSIILADIAVSRKHTMVCLEGNQWVVRDLGSGNGTLLNGRRVESHVLRDGDQLELGNTLLRFINPQESAAQLADQATVLRPHDPRGTDRLQAAPAAAVSQPAQAVQAAGVVAPDRDRRASRRRKLLIFGSLAVVLLLGGMLVLKKFLVARKQQQASASGEAVKSPDEVAAQEFQEGTTRYRARDWEKARAHFLKVLTLAPTFDQAKRYADQAAAEMAARDALERAKNSLGAKDFKTARLELSKIPSTSVYAAEGLKQKQRVDGAQLTDLLKKARAFKDDGNPDAALEEVKKARELAPTNTLVRGLYEELTAEVGDPNRKPAAVAAAPARAAAPASARRPAPARPRAAPSAAYAHRPIGRPAATPRRTRAAPTIRVSGGSKAAIAAYRNRDWGPAFKAAKDLAAASTGRKQKSAEALAEAIRKVGQNWLRAERAGSGSLTLKYYAEALKYDRKISRKGYHQAELKKRIYDTARREATSALARQQYTSAYSAYKMARKYGPEDATLRRVMSSLEKKASALFTKGYTKRGTNIAYARKLWQQVLKMVPPSSQVYQKAYTWLNNSAPSYDDEDED
jgi:pSer/pThr/pTyr-binding forkhead associated (FHA) protein